MMKSFLSRLLLVGPSLILFSTGSNAQSRKLLSETVQCTVFSISGTSKRGISSYIDEDTEYNCETDHNYTYRIFGDLGSFIGSSYKSSQTTLIFPASITGGKKVIYLDDDIVRSSISFSNPVSKSRNRSQQRNQGSYKGLIIRVVDSTGDAPEESMNDIYGAFFDDDVNFGISVKSVFLGCSDNQFEISPATGNALTNGVIQISLDSAVSGRYYSDVSDDVLALLPSSGIDDYTYTFMVFPESVELSSSGGNTVGKGEMPGTKTWYKSTNVQYVPLGVHEIGHNLYQYHSGADSNGNSVFEDDEEYDDPTCTMGGEWGDKSEGKKCFNAAKTYYLGWFSSYHAEATPTNSAFSGTLVGVNDAGNDEISLSDQYVTMQISGSDETDLFLMYNRVEGVNSFMENMSYSDKVVVVEQSAAGEMSWIKAVLDQGDTYTQGDWAGTGNSLNVKVCSMSSGTPDTASVGIWLDGVNDVSDCVAPPTLSPAPSTQYKEIRYVGNPCTLAFPLTGTCEECTGDCDYDSDCEGNLICYQRSSGDNIPGCIWGTDADDLKEDNSDYCYSPDALEGVINYAKECDSTDLCGRCEGDCDSDNDCETGLQCLQRSAFEAVPGCTGEGGDYDSTGNDVCYSTSTPAPTTPSTPAPTPTTDSTCEDSPLRFKVVKDGSSIARYCSWVANRATSSRCDLDGVKAQCPSTCNACSDCVDSPLRLKFFYNGNKITRSCIWVANKNTDGRCQVDGMSNTCRSTCGTC